MGQIPKNLRKDYSVQWKGESETDARWEERLNGKECRQKGRSHSSLISMPAGKIEDRECRILIISFCDSKQSA